MPPKKDVPPKQKKLPPMVVDELDPKVMNLKELLKYCLKVMQVIEENRKENSLFLVEKEKISAFWDITREQLVKREKDLRFQKLLRERVGEYEDLERIDGKRAERDLEFKSHCKQMMRRATNGMTRFLNRKTLCAMELELMRDKRCLTVQLMEQQELHEMRVKQLNMSHYQSLVKKRIEDENEDRDQRMRRYELWLEVRANTALACANKQKIVEYNKNLEVKRLLENYELKFKDLKDYYNDITLSNLALIQQLKDDSKIAKKELTWEENCVSTLTTEYHQLKGSLETTQAKILAVKNALPHYGNDRVELAKQKQRFHRNERELNAMKWEHQVLVLRNEMLIVKHEELKERFHKWFSEMLRVTSLKDVLLSQKIIVLEKEVEKPETMQKVKDKAGLHHICESYRKDLIALLEVKQQELEMWNSRAIRYANCHDAVLQAGKVFMQSNWIPDNNLENPLIGYGETREICECELD